MSNTKPRTIYAPTPWAVDQRYFADINDANGTYVCSVRNVEGKEALAERTSKIITAVNSHDALVKIAKHFISMIGSATDGDEITFTPEDIKMRNKALAALAQAKAKEVGNG